MTWLWRRVKVRIRARFSAVASDKSSFRVRARLG
jgi:hypothetical protein